MNRLMSELSGAYENGMGREHRMLLRSLLDGGGIPIRETIESHRILAELLEAGLVEIAHPDGQCPDGNPLSPEYRLTARGRELAGS